jgi:serine/threonine-protein kinase
VKVSAYEVIRRLGEGAYGKVYLARRGDPHGFVTWYALKRLRREHTASEAFRHYLLREARLGGLVNHPGLVRIHEVFQHDGHWVLVMDYVDGVTLRQMMAARRGSGAGLPREVALEVGASVLDALHYLHTLVDPEGQQRGFVHRDVKPGNIMVTVGGGVRLMDFGVAHGEEFASVTQVGELRGTIAYMAPEQASGESAGPAADQFAAGLVLLEMLTGETAWGDARGPGVLHKVVAGDVTEGLVRVDATDPVGELLLRMLQPQPKDRFPSARDAARALRELRAKIPVMAALPDFAAEEIERLRGGQDSVGTLEEAPSWGRSEPLGPSSSGTWTGAGSDPRVLSTPPNVAAGLAPPIPGAPGTGGEIAVGAAPRDPEPTPPPLLVDAEPTRPGAALPAADEDGLDRTLPFSATRSAPRAESTLPPALAFAARSVPSLESVRRPTPPPVPGALSGSGVYPPGIVASEGPPPATREMPPRPGLLARLDFVGSPLVSSLLAALAATGLFVIGWILFREEAEPDPEPDPFAGGAAAGADGEELPGLAQVSGGEEGPPGPAEEPVPGALDPVAAAEARNLSENERLQLAVLGGAGSAEPVPDVGQPAAPRPSAAPGPGGAASPASAPSAGSVMALERSRSPNAPGSAGVPQPGQVVGEPARTRPARDLELRRVGDSERPGSASARASPSSAGAAPAGASSSTAAAAPEPEPAGPRLRFLSAVEQPLGAPLSLRVRAEGFRASAISVYYQWRGEGGGGRRKRSLAEQGDGSFSFEVPAADLRADRLQLWFIAEPGGVVLRSSQDPLEIRVR